MKEKVTHDRIDIACKFIRGGINEQQAMFLLITDGLSEGEAEIFLESMQYSIYTTTKAILKICSWALVVMIGIATLVGIFLLVF